MPARTRSAGLTEEIAMLVIRLAKIVCVAALALDLALVAFDNLTDYGTNFSFVAKVLSMSDIPPSWRLAFFHWARRRWRRLRNSIRPSNQRPPGLRLALFCTRAAFLRLAANGSECGNPKPSRMLFRAPSGSR